MDTFDTLPPELFGEIMSHNTNTEEQLNFALNVPAGLIAYNSLRQNPDYWLDKLEKEFHLNIPSIYFEDTAILERFYTICCSVIKPARNPPDSRSFTSMLPEIYILIKIIGENYEEMYKCVDEKGYRFADMYSMIIPARLYTDIAFEFNVTFMQNLYELLAAKSMRFAVENSSLVANIMIEVVSFAESKDFLDKFFEVLFYSKRYFPKETDEEFIDSTLNIKFVSYEFAISLMKLLKNVGYETTELVFTSDKLFPRKGLFIKETAYYAEISMYVIEHARIFDKETVKDFESKTGPTLNQLLLILYNVNRDPNFIDLNSVKLNEETKYQYFAFWEYCTEDENRSNKLQSIVNRLSTVYRNNKLLETLNGDN